MTVADNRPNPQVPLETEDLTAGYAVEPVLRGISFSIGRGEVVGILGPNGSGKSTLLRTIAGLNEPWSGRVTLDGQPIDGKTTEWRVRQGLMLVPEGRRLFRGMTVLDNLRAGACSGRRGPTVDDVFELFPALSDRRMQTAGTLSGGEQQMLAIGRALRGDPEVLLIDEPSLGLAPLIVESVMEVLGRLADQGRAVIIAEQNVPVATSVARRCLVLANGEIGHEGPTQTDEQRAALRDAYAHLLQMGDAA